MKFYTKIILRITRALRIESSIISLSRIVPFLQKLVPHPGFYKKKDEITVTRNSTKFSLNRSDWMQWHIYADLPDNSWKLALDDLVKRNNSAPVIFDIGSNVGGFTFKLAAGLKKASMGNFKIFAFDPNSYIAEKFKKNMWLNSLDKETIHFNQEALSDSKGVATFGFNMENTGTGTLNTKGIEVKQNTLNDFCIENSIIKVDFIKIDVEGFEPFVFDGARKIIERDLPAMYIEISPKMYINNNRSAEEIFNYLFGLNYQIFMDDESSLKNIPKDAVEKLIENEQFNILALPKSKS